MKKILISGLLLLSSCFANAQFKVEATGGINIPMGEVSSSLGTGYGVNLTAKKFFFQKFALGLTSGYNTLPYSELTSSSFNYIPIGYHLREINMLKL